MSIEALVLGKLHELAKQRTSGNTGRQFVTAKVRAAVAEGESLYVNVVTFSESAGAALLALEIGDSVALAGTLKPTAWTDREGYARPAADLVTTQVMTTYGLTKKRNAVRQASAAPAADTTAHGQRQPPQVGNDFESDPEWLQGEQV